MDMSEGKSEPNKIWPVARAERTISALDLFCLSTFPLFVLLPPPVVSRTQLSCTTSAQNSEERARPLSSSTRMKVTW